MYDPIVLIPGLMCDARMFGHQLMTLSRDRTVTIALPTQGTTIEEMSQAILPQLPARFALVGLGLGAHVALDIVRRDMARVTRLCLMSVDPLSETPALAAARDKRIILAQTGRLLDAMSQELPTTALAPSAVRDEVVTLAEDMALSLGAAIFVNQIRALQRRRDQQKTLRRASMSALILAGAQDTLVPVRRQDFMAQLMPTARVQVIAGAGHLPPLEAAEATTAALANFLNGPLLLV